MTSGTSDSISYRIRQTQKRSNHGNVFSVNEFETAMTSYITPKCIKIFTINKEQCNRQKCMFFVRSAS